MQRPHYQLEEAPVYTEEIPKLLNTDPVVAESGQFYELIARMLNNTRALARKVAELEGDLAGKVGKGTPREFDLELMKGLELFYEASYSKDEFNRVYLSFSLKKPVGVSIGYAASIAVLPEGFRPARRTVIPAAVSVLSKRLLVTVDVRTDGNITMHNDSSVDLGEANECSIFLNGSFTATE